MARRNKVKSFPLVQLGKLFYVLMLREEMKAVGNGAFAHVENFNQFVESDAFTFAVEQEIGINFRSQGRKPVGFYVMRSKFFYQFFFRFVNQGFKFLANL